jgi:endonuclease/exonuclease/phosphatase family metal-dependent hydrolase
MTVESDPLNQTTADVYAAVRRRIVPRLNLLAACRSERELLAHPVYRDLAPLVEEALATTYIADFRRGPAPARQRYRVVAWNIERGRQLAAQLELFRSHPYLSHADVLLLTEADAGMARSGNQMVAEALARELGMAVAFAPCYIAFGKGSGVERDAGGENTFALHGNALLSRYPISRVRQIPLVNGVDKVAHREKRLGRQSGVAARVEFANLAFEAVSVHLDAQSTQRHRCLQMRAILDAVPAHGPALVGGDWNTSTYDSSHALWAILGFWLRVMMGVDHVIRNHYLQPERKFERALFRLLEERGFEYNQSNSLGDYTTYYDANNDDAVRNLGEWVPAWCFAFIRWGLRHHGGRCPFKLDWFATRGLQVAGPLVLHDLAPGPAKLPLSDHDPIGVDVIVADRAATKGSGLRSN